MGVFLGLMASLSWGMSYFVGAYATRRVGVIRSVYYGNWLGLLFACCLVIFTGEWLVYTQTSLAIWAWLILGTSLNTIASIFNNLALKIGVVSIVTPITANYALVTALLAILNGSSFTTLQWAGVVATVIGISLVSQKKRKSIHEIETEEDKNFFWGILWALIAAIFYGSAYWVIGAQVSPVMGGVAPSVFFSLTAIIILALFVISRRQTYRLQRLNLSEWKFVAPVATTNSIATVATFIGYTVADVAVVTIISSTYSAVTVVLARVFMKEQLSRIQQLGVVSLIIGVLMVSI